MPQSKIRVKNGKYESGTCNSRSRGALGLKLGWWVGLTWLYLHKHMSPGWPGLALNAHKVVTFVGSERSKGGGDLSCPRSAGQALTSKKYL